MKVCYLDHYDSFSFNLIDCLFSDSSFELVYIASDNLDKMGEDWVCNMPLIISPGPHRPDNLPSTMSLISRSLGKIPILGICLGHQCLGVVAGGHIIPAKQPFHGLANSVVVTQFLPDLPRYPKTFKATQYNSLVIDRSSLAEGLIWAENEEGEVQGLVIGGERHSFLAWGVQFHPESFLSEHKHLFVEAWAQMVRNYYNRK